MGLTRTRGIMCALVLVAVLIAMGWWFFLLSCENGFSTSEANHTATGTLRTDSESPSHDGEESSHSFRPERVLESTEGEAQPESHVLNVRSASGVELHAVDWRIAGDAWNRTSVEAAEPEIPIVVPAETGVIDVRAPGHRTMTVAASEDRIFLEPDSQLLLYQAPAEFAEQIRGGIADWFPEEERERLREVVSSGPLPGDRYAVLLSAKEYTRRFGGSLEVRFSLPDLREVVVHLKVQAGRFAEVWLPPSRPPPGSRWFDAVLLVHGERAAPSRFKLDLATFYADHDGVVESFEWGFVSVSSPMFSRSWEAEGPLARIDSIPEGLHYRLVVRENERPGRFGAREFTFHGQRVDIALHDGITVRADVSLPVGFPPVKAWLEAHPGLTDNKFIESEVARSLWSISRRDVLLEQDGEIVCHGPTSVQPLPGVSELMDTGWPFVDVDIEASGLLPVHMRVAVSGDTIDLGRIHFEERPWQLMLRGDHLDARSYLFGVVIAPYRESQLRFAIDSAVTLSDGTIRLSLKPSRVTGRSAGRFRVSGHEGIREEIWRDVASIIVMPGDDSIRRNTEAFSLREDGEYHAVAKTSYEVEVLAGSDGSTLKWGWVWEGLSVQMMRSQLMRANEVVGFDAPVEGVGFWWVRTDSGGAVQEGKVGVTQGARATVGWTPGSD